MKDKTGTGPTILQSRPYDDIWYEHQIESSYRSAEIYVAQLGIVFRPKSVIDVGCGRGAWLKAFHEAGAESLVGVDGPWNSQEKMVDPSIIFHPADLDKPIFLGVQRFDLALSLEVAEHLRPESALTFIESLTSLSDVVLFGAAYSGQGGADHINEQPCTYWAILFEKFGYAPYDLFRPLLWGNDRVEFWYQQNTFLYVKQNTDEQRRLAVLGVAPMQSIQFMNCIHPAMYDYRVRLSQVPFRQKYVIEPLIGCISKIIPRKLLPLARRIWRAISKAF